MSPRERRLLEWIGRAEPLLDSQVAGSGLNRALHELLIAGLADITAHPTVREGKAPAAGVILTPAGRKVLGR